MSFLKKVTSRYSITAGDVVPFPQKKYEHGFDLTSVDTPANWKKILKAAGITNMEAKLEKRKFIWQGPDILIATGNNPLTGEYGDSERGRDLELGYASYIGLEGNKDKVMKVVKLIQQYDPKDESPGKRRFI